MYPKVIKIKFTKIYLFKSLLFCKDERTLYINITDFLSLIQHVCYTKTFVIYIYIAFTQKINAAYVTHYNLKLMSHMKRRLPEFEKPKRESWFPTKIISQTKHFPRIILEWLANALCSSCSLAGGSSFFADRESF